MAIDVLSSQYLLLEADMGDIQCRRVASGTAALYSAPSPVSETPNQDGVAIIPCGADRAVLAIADGLGGRPSGAAAARLALEALACCVESAADSGIELRDAILNGFEQANRAVTDLGVGAATTLAVVEVDADRIRPYHAGDSSILVVGQRGKVRLATIDHSPVGYAVESGMLEAREAMHHEDRHLVSNMVGSEDMRIEVGAAMQVRLRDTVLIATDGLTDNLHGEEIVALVRTGALHKAGVDLIAANKQRMNTPKAGTPSKPDDVSFMLFRLNQSDA